MVQYSFKRDEEGKLCPNKTYSKELLNKTSFKYPEQGRFSFGVAKIRKIGADKAEGVRMEHINYTNKNICTIDVFAKHMKEEWDRVRKLTGEKNSMWVENGRPENELWENDNISHIKGTGDKKGKPIVITGIKTVVELKAVQDKDLLELKGRCPGISLATLCVWRDTPCHDGTCPHKKVDHRQAANPYLSKYGVDEWRKEIENSVFMRKYMCVTELVKKMHDRTK